MTLKINGFFAYPANPVLIGETIEAAMKKGTNSDIIVETWRELDIPGRFISERVLSGIDKGVFFIADITRLNFNVTYEIGYAIGRSKRIILTRNSSIKEVTPKINEVGIFDTLGYSTYQNSNELLEIINNVNKRDPLNCCYEKNKKAPVYLNEAKFKTDWATTLISKVKKARLFYRSFDPNEQPRLSAYDAIKQVSQSFGVLIHLLPSHIADHEVHNLRAAFIAGLAEGMNKVISIIQNGDDPVPLDYRDFVKTCYHPSELLEAVHDFAGKIIESLQQDIKPITKGKETFLESLDLGSSSAENELRDLGNYYLETDSFRRVTRGEARIVVGRKGSGKTAIFLQVRDKHRQDKDKVVLDLKPDGYKLLKFKDMVLKLLEDGSFYHTIMVFWEYVLLLEICHKILVNDKDAHLRNHDLYDGYRSLQILYESEEYFTEGDFSERISNLMDRISQDYQHKYGIDKRRTLSSPEITELIFKHDIHKIHELLEKYLSKKDSLWILFDNLDKGWPTHGIQPIDLVIIRALLEATRKIERQMSRKKLKVHTVIFLRNDVYELLVEETADRGKESKVLLDWTDPDMLRELARRRIAYSNLDDNTSFDDLWPQICVSHIAGEESSQYLIDRSLMRPRFLIDLLNYCKSFAVNLNHIKISVEDIEKGFNVFSNDLIQDISLEIRDVYPNAENIIYEFIGVEPVINEIKIIDIIKEKVSSDENASDIFRLLLWYGFIGVKNNGDILYIHNFNYNMKTMEGMMNKNRSSGKLMFSVNPAFWPGLFIDS